jgi:heme A synthase
VTIAGLVANVVIVLTGALVRLTGSGLGCRHGPGAPTTPS